MLYFLNYLLRFFLACLHCKNSLDVFLFLLLFELGYLLALVLSNEVPLLAYQHNFTATLLDHDRQVDNKVACKEAYMEPANIVPHIIVWHEIRVQ